MGFAEKTASRRDANMLSQMSKRKSGFNILTLIPAGPGGVIHRRSVINSRFLRITTVSLLTIWTFAIPLPSNAQFPRLPKIPKIPGTDKIEFPGLDRVLSEPPAITTSLDNAVTELPFLDDAQPQNFIPMQVMPRGNSGEFFLAPGDYSFEAQSYCLHAGTYAPSSGDGYLYAPLLGPRENIIQNLLQRSYTNAQVPQRNVQVLIWAILARTKVAEMPNEMKQTANILLTPDEINQLNGGALGYIPDNVRERAFAKLPDDARRVYEAENRLRQLMAQPGVSYEQLERVAVLTGNAPVGRESRQVPLGRWSYDSRGFFVRYFPENYSHTRIELSVPANFTLTRDAQGRITLIADRQGNKLQLAYDDSLASSPMEGDAGVRAVALRSVSFVQEGEASAQKFDGTLWTFVGVPSGHGHGGIGAKTFPGLDDRYVEASRRKDEFAQVVARVGARSGAKLTADVMDLAHLRMALMHIIRSAAAVTAPAEVEDFSTHAWEWAFANEFGGSAPVASLDGTAVPPQSGKRSGTPQMALKQVGAFSAAVREFAFANQFASNAAVASSAAAPVAPLPAQRSGPLTFNPGGTVAVPGETGRQRLAQSGRCVPPDVNLSSRASKLQESVADALSSHDHLTNPDDVQVNNRYAGHPLTTFAVRLSADNRPLPTLACLKNQIAEGNVPPGSIEGANKVLLGSVQQANNQTRVTSRIVDVESGEILATGKGDAAGTDQNAIDQAADKSIANLFLQ
jgi:hypothetical protein